MTNIHRLRSSVLVGIAVSLLAVSTSGQAQTSPATGDGFVGRMAPKVLQEKLRLLFRPGSPHEAAMEKQKRDMLRIGRSTDLDADPGFQPLPFVSVEQPRAIKGLFESVLAPPVVPFDQIPVPTFGLVGPDLKEIPVPETRPRVAKAEEKVEATKPEKAEKPRRERRRFQRERRTRAEVTERRRVAQGRGAPRREAPAARQRTERSATPEPNFLEKIFGPRASEGEKKTDVAPKPAGQTTR